MSKSIMDKILGADPKLQNVVASGRGQAILKQISNRLPDPYELRKACRDFLAHPEASFENLRIETKTEAGPAERQNQGLPSGELQPRQTPRARPRIPKGGSRKQKFGLPEGFVPRFERYGRSVLLEDNIYRLPNGQEFIPCHPEGMLGQLRHLYALITTEQYRRGKRGSVYIRTDGRIFDYSVDHADFRRDMFDTGYTINDLERTGQYGLDHTTHKRAHEVPAPRKFARRQMIRKLKSGQYRLYSRKKDPKTGKRKNLGTFDSREAAEKHERDVQYFKRKG